ncbi:MAG: hypothetical protein KGH97_01655 [Patescibacteria group bacterium]|nr:hypothetical protein [Patescibacteria group bacterium]
MDGVRTFDGQHAGGTINLAVDTLRLGITTEGRAERVNASRALAEVLHDLIKDFTPADKEFVLALVQDGRPESQEDLPL